MKLFENKKLFGKINWIDIVLIVLVLGVLLFLYWKSGRAAAVIVPTQKLSFDFEMQNMPEGVADYIKVGDKLYDNETNVFLGIVKDVKISEYKEITANYEKNEFENTIKPDSYCALITVESDVVDTGINLQTTDGYVIKVGKYIYVRGSNYAGRGYIVHIER